MKKKIIRYALFLNLLFVVIAIFGCARDQTPTDQDKEGPALGYIPTTSYESIYRNDRIDPYPVNPAIAVHRASHGYLNMAMQGYNGWTYEVDTGSGYFQMVYHAPTGRWTQGSSYIKGASQHAHAGTTVAKAFTVMQGGSGRVTISLNARKTQGAPDAHFSITKNDVRIYPVDAGYLVLNDHAPYGTHVAFELDVAVGDVIRFVTHQGIVLVNPLIAYGTLAEQSIHFDFHPDRFPNNYTRAVGDVHPFYHDGKLYLFYLETNGRYSAALLESTNMINYAEVPIQTSQPQPAISTYYALGITRYNDSFVSYFGASATHIHASISHDLYTWRAFTPGPIPVINKATGRDPFIFYDEDIDRYRIIYTSYNSRDRTPDGNFDAFLTLKTSVGPDMSAWEAEEIDLLRYDNAGPSGKEDPEVSQMVKIGNRWYLIASIYGRSVHGVGRLSYWKGEPDTPIHLDNWSEKVEQHLDGEDIAAAQLFEVGDRWYMLGWVPQHPQSSQWGGALSLLREVYQLENGDLATRLDPHLYGLLNHGRMYDWSMGGLQSISGTSTIGERNVLISGEQSAYGFSRYGEMRLPGTYNRVILNFTLSLWQDNNQGGIVLQAEGTPERHYIVINRQTSTLSILSRTPEGNFTRSIITLEIDDWSDVKVTIFIEPTIIDVFVNDRFSLASKVNVYGIRELRNMSIGLFSDRFAEFVDFEISKLADRRFIYE